jgi:hypothetical protein
VEVCLACRRPLVTWALNLALTHMAPRFKERPQLTHQSMKPISGGDFNVTKGLMHHLLRQSRQCTPRPSRQTPPQGMPVHPV